MKETTRKENDPTPANGLILKVGSFNIKHGHMAPDMTHLAALIRGANLDIAGVQEVDINTARVGKRDTLKLLAEAAGYPHYTFVKSTDFGGGEYGTAILSRYPITSLQVTPLYTSKGAEKRALGYATVNINGQTVHFFNTHLSLDASDRTAEFEELAAAVRNTEGFILTGDFNTADTAAFSPIGNYTLSNKGQYATFPELNSGIDEIVLHTHWRVLETGMVATTLSDHNMLWAKIQYTGEV